MPNQFRLFLYILSFLLIQDLTATSAWQPAPESGTPLLRTHTPNDYPGGPRNHQITHDSAGNTYVANEAGVLKFNGTNWSRLPKQSGTNEYLGIAVDAADRIWVSRPQQVGYYAANTYGAYKYRDMTADIEARLPQSDYGQFREIHQAPTGLYIVCDYAILRWANNQLTHWKFQTKTPIQFCTHKSSVYIHVLGVGVYTLKDSELIQLTQALPDDFGSLIQILSNSTGDLLALNTSGDLWNISLAKPQAIPLKQPHAQTTPLELHQAIPLNSELYAVSSSNCGVLVLNLQHQTLTRIHWEDDDINHLALSPTGKLWASTTKHLLELQDVPISHYRSPQIKDIIRHQGTLFTAGELSQQLTENDTSGKHSLNILNGLNNSTSMLKSGGNLFITSPNRIHILRNNLPQQIVPITAHSPTLLASQVDPQIIYALTPTSAHKLSEQNGRWQVVDTRHTHPINNHSVIELADGSLLATTNRKGVEHIPWSQSPTPTRQFGLPKSLMWSQFLQQGQHAILLSEKGIYSFDRSKKQFFPQKHLAEYLSQGVSDFAASKLQNQTGWLIAIYPNSTEIFTPLLGKLYFEKSELHWTPLQLPRLGQLGRIEALYHEIHNQNELLWFGTNNGLFRYDLSNLKHYPTEEVILTAIKETDNSQSYYDGAGVPHRGLQLPYPQTSLHFEFSSPASTLQVQSYQTRLIGLSNQWSSPSSKTYRNFNNLKEGAYRFEVRAIDEFARKGPKCSFSFNILPPWYRSKFAYATYLSAAILLLLALIRIWTSHLRNRNEELEHTVTQRTLELERRNLELTEANNIKQYFLASMSHEIRNPMNGILGIARLLKEDSKYQKTNNERVNHLFSCANHLHQLLGEVLDYSSLEAGKLQVNKVCYNAIDLVSEVIDIHLEQATEKGLDLSATTPLLSHQWIGDPVLLRQILINLVSNAIKYTEKGHVHLHLRVKDNLISYIVEDTGAGIPKDQTNQIFDKFTRLNNAMEREISGTGLGLTIAKEMSDLMHGKLYIDPSYTHGARFVLELTLNESNLPIRSKTHHTGVYESRPLRNLRVLVADDMDFNRYINAQITQRMGASTDEASSGEEALNKLLSNNYDIALLDINMPDITGIEVVKKYLDGSPVQPPQLIALSAYKTDIMEASCLAAGFDRFLEKPLEPEKLLLVRKLNPTRVTTLHKTNQHTSLFDYLSQTEGKTSIRMEHRYRSSFSKQLHALKKALENNDHKAQRTILHKIHGLISLKKDESVTQKINTISELREQPERQKDALKICDELIESVTMTKPI